ncbi:hypothetical protein H2201_008892 [Coniosporium apollinis]|uniref:Ubiquitin 3 binding protein But2 C-terminal domain-containing protein n=1 Tax=Coniosporium apollinis TaxID=61459 RepID=A0ABQ9NF54_9PEZI|nr:hypothetical protein H2201_008892 [Coniosporium apollinis]
MKSTVFASVLLFAISALGAPTATRTLISRSPGNITGLHSASPTETIYPSLQVRWKSKEPTKLASNDRIGHLLSNLGTPGEQVHTAVYFTISPEQAGRDKTCKLVFRLSVDDWAIGSSAGYSPVFDIFRLNGCLNDKYSWNNRVPRGAYAGSATPVKGGAAAWQSADMSTDTMVPYMGASPTFTCAAGEYSFEMIARPGVNIGWTTGSGSGLSIETCG